MSLRHAVVRACLATGVAVGPSTVHAAFFALAWLGLCGVAWRRTGPAVALMGAAWVAAVVLPVNTELALLNLAEGWTM